MPAGKHKTIPIALLDGLGQIDNLRHIGEVVQREPHRLRLESFKLLVKLAMLKNLQVQDANVVSCRPDCGRDPLHPQRFKTEINLAVH